MLGPVKRTLRRWLRLPDDPRPPQGAVESVRVFHAAPGYFHYAVARWGLRQTGVLLGFLFALALGSLFLDDFLAESSGVVTAAVESLPAWLVSLAEHLRLLEIESAAGVAETRRYSLGPGIVWLEWLALALFVVQLPISYTLVRMDYELRFYIVTDRSLRIREGITRLRESTMTFDNIQNLAIRQGPIQRLFGIADLRVRTAGGGAREGHEDSGEESAGKGDSMHIAYFRGVDNAEQLRDSILARLKTLKDAGLGAPEDRAPADDAQPLIDAAQRMLDEARALRSSLTA